MMKIFLVFLLACSPILASTPNNIELIDYLNEKSDLTFYKENNSAVLILKNNGDIIIPMNNGKVTIQEKSGRIIFNGYTPDKASLAFWDALVLVIKRNKIHKNE